MPYYATSYEKENTVLSYRKYIQMVSYNGWLLLFNDCVFNVWCYCCYCYVFMSSKHFSFVLNFPTLLVLSHSLSLSLLCFVHTELVPLTTWDINIAVLFTLVWFFIYYVIEACSCVYQARTFYIVNVFRSEWRQNELSICWLWRHYSALYYFSYIYDEDAYIETILYV